MGRGELFHGTFRINSIKQKECHKKANMVGMVDGNTTYEEGLR